jgi:hypothetical protein
VKSGENVDLTTVMLSGLRSGSLPRKPWTFSANGVFFDHALRVLVVPQACETSNAAGDRFTLHTAPLH